MICHWWLYRRTWPNPPLPKRKLGTLNIEGPQDTWNLPSPSYKIQKKISPTKIICGGGGGVYIQWKIRIQIHITRKLKKTLWPLFMDEVQLSQGYNHFKKAVYFLLLSSQKYLELLLSNSEGWKAESTLESPSGFEHKTLELRIQCLN